MLITEVLYENNIPGTDSIKEWIELYNSTSSAIDLTGWTISDNVGTYINLFDSDNNLGNIH